MNAYFKNDLTHTVELLEVTLTTIYPQIAIGVNNDGYSTIIQYNDIDNVFEIPIKAERKLREIRMELTKYESEDFINFVVFVIWSNSFICSKD